MNKQKKPYAGPALPPAAIVHLSDRMIPEFVVCGITMAAGLRRTRAKDAVTCLDCLAIDEAARKAASGGAS